MHYLIVSALLASQAAIAVRVTTLDERTISGDIHAWSAERLEIETAEGDHAALRVDQVLRVDLPTSAMGDGPAPAGELLFVDGGHLALSGIATDEVRATITGAPVAAGDDKPLACPLDQVRAVRLMALDPAAPTLQQQWQDLLRSEPAGDLIVIRKPGAANLNFVEGSLGTVASDTITFTLDGETIQVNRQKVFGLVYFRQPSQQQPAGTTLLEGRGLRLPASKVRLRQGMLQATSPVLGVILLRPTVVRAVDYSVDRLQYLSDLPPARVDWTPPPATEPLATLQQGMVRDRGFYAPELKIDYPADLLPPDQQSSAGLPGTRTFTKGLAIRSRTTLAYRVPAGFSFFRATVGADPRTGGAGAARLTVRGDGQTLAVHEVRGHEPPLDLECDIRGLRELTIEVDFGVEEGLNAGIGSIVHLGGARFVK